MYRRMVAMLLSGLILAAAAVRSQQSEQMSLSIGESVTIMLEKSRVLSASQLGVESANARAKEARGAGLMSVKLQAAYTRLSEVPSFSIGPPLMSNPVLIYPSILDNYSARLSIQQPLFSGSRFSGTISMADFLAGATQEEYNQNRADLTLTAKKAYWKLHLARETRKVIAENVRQVELHLTEIKNLFDQGMATRNEVLRVEVQYSEAKVREISAENNAQLALYALNNILGLPLDTRIELTTEPHGDSVTVPSPDMLVRYAISNRADMRAVELQAKAAEEGVAVTRSGYYPQISLVGNFYYSRPNQRIFPAVDEFRDTWDVGVSLSWDVWNWGTTVHQSTQAETRLAQAKNGIEQLRDAIVLEITQAHYALKEAQQRIVVTRKAVSQGEEHYRSVRNKFKSGLIINAELSDAEASLLSTKWIHIQALADYNIAIAELERASAMELFQQ